MVNVVCCYDCVTVPVRPVCRGRTTLCATTTAWNKEVLHRDTYTSARALKLQIFLNMGIAANKLQSADKFEHFLKFL